MAPYELPSVLVPGWIGFGGATYWGGMPFTDYPNAFVGLVAVLLAIPAFLAGGRRRVFALVLALLALLVSFGRYFPLYGFLYDHLPLFNKFRVPVMVIILFQLAVALGVAWGWSAILPDGGRADDARARARRVGRLLAVLGGVVALVLVLSVLGQGAWRDAYVRGAMAHKGSTAVTMGTAGGAEGYGAEEAAAAWQVFFSGIRPASGLSADLGVPGLGWVPGLVLACVLGLLALGAAWAARRGWLGALPATALVLVIMLLELWPVSAHVMGPVVGEVAARDLDAGRDDVVRFLEQAGPRGSFRIFTYRPDEPVPNRYAGFAIGNLSGYHAAKPKLFEDLAAGHLYNYVDMEWLRLLNVRYVVQCEARAQQVPPPPDLRPVFRSSQTANPNFGPLLVFEFPAALPRATLLEHYAVVPDGEGDRGLDQPAPARRGRRDLAAGGPEADARAGGRRARGHRLLRAEPRDDRRRHAGAGAAAARRPVVPGLARLRGRPAHAGPPGRLPAARGGRPGRAAPGRVPLRVGGGAQRPAAVAGEPAGRAGRLRRLVVAGAAAAAGRGAGGGRLRWRR